MRRIPRGSPALLFSVWVVAAAAAATAPRSPLQLLAVSPSSPRTLADLEAAHAALVSYEPATGIAYVTGDAAEEARLVAAGFHVATAEPDLFAGLRALQGAPDLGLYHTYDEMVALLDSLATRHADVCRMVSIGKSLENRDIWALEISDDPGVLDPAEPAVLVVGCHHAREFMSVEVPLDFARTVLEGRATDPRIAALVADRDLWIVPMLNPDGHVYQEQFQAGPNWVPPGWRKNRRPNFDGSYGVDLNRNYGYLWGYDDEGSSGDPVNETYRGTAPFSEPETRCLADLVVARRFVISISYHSFGRSLLYPWGYTNRTLPEDADLFAALADSMVRDTGYRPGNAYYRTIYRTNGDLDDWAYGELSARKPQRTLAFTTELNSESEGGFWPPEELIEPTCRAMRAQNLFALAVAAAPRAPLPPPSPLLTGSQNAVDGRRIHLQWTQPVDAANPVDHWEVFEVAPGGLVAAPPAVELYASGRAILAHDLQRPAGGRLAVRVDADLLPVWDAAVLEARAPGGAWTPLVVRAAPAAAAGASSMLGWTGTQQPRLVSFDLAPVAGATLDVALRLTAVPGRPRPARLRARLDVAATWLETRRVLDPDVRQPAYDFVAPRSGIFAYGITAVDMQGQRSESNLLFFVVPTVAVDVNDVECRRQGDRITLQWRAAADGEAVFEAWTRVLGGDELPGDRGIEWEGGAYALAARTTASGGGTITLAWQAGAGRVAVLLRATDRDGTRLWGPWIAARPELARLRLDVPNPFPPGAACAFELVRDGAVRLDVVRADGRIVRALVDGSLAAGPHRIGWDGRDARGVRVAAGVYLVRLRSDGAVTARRTVLLPGGLR